MFRIRTTVLVVATSLLLAGFALANRGKPNFTPALYADGEAWGTKAAAEIPAPNEHNAHSFDKLIVFTNAPMGQMPVAEAAPGNPNYNGGRWFTHMATWTEAGGNFYLAVGLPILMSYAEVEENVAMGYLTVTPGSPAGGPPPYFECPLLPTKSGR